MTPADIADVVRRDPRYAIEAYEFLLQSLSHTQKLLGRVPFHEPREPGEEHHVCGRELLQGTCDLARKEFGFLAKTVFRQWGIQRTDDIGEIIFNLIEAHVLTKTENDNRNDFHNVFEIDRILTEGFSIPQDEGIWSKRSGR